MIKMFLNGEYMSERGMRNLEILLRLAQEICRYNEKCIAWWNEDVRCNTRNTKIVYNNITEN